MKTKKTKHADPNHKAIAAILAIDLDAFENDHARIAAALEPFVAAAPALREWEQDDVWTPAEEACATASALVRDVKVPVGKDPWMNVQNQLDRLRRSQVAHRDGLIYERLGEFPGYKIRVRDCLHPRIMIWPKEVSTDLEAPMLTLDSDITRHELQNLIYAWKDGHSRGLNEGTKHIQRRLRDLLGIEAD